MSNKKMIGKVVKVTLSTGDIIQGVLAYEGGAFRIAHYWQYDVSNCSIQLV
jgi:hypothetical protein